MKNPPLAQPQHIDTLNLGFCKFTFFKVKKRALLTPHLSIRWYFGLVTFSDNLLPLLRAKKHFLCKHF